MKLETSRYEVAFIALWGSTTYAAAWCHASIAAGRLATMKEAATEHNLARLVYAIVLLYAVNYLIEAWRRRSTRNI